MSNIDDQISKLKLRVSNAEKALTRAEVEREAADKQYAETMASLKEGFEVDTLDDARAMLAQLQGDLSASMAKVSELLDKHNF